MVEEINEIEGFCPICLEEKALQYGKKASTLNVRGEKIEVISNEQYCIDGKHSFSTLDDEEERYQNAYREYRNRKGLLQSEEIKEIREKYDLSQREFAQILGFGTVTIHRYETGAIQDEAHNTMLVLISDTTAFQKLFERKKNALSARTIKKVDAKLKTLLHSSCQIKLDYYEDDFNVYKGQIAKWEPESLLAEKTHVKLAMTYKKTASDSYMTVKEMELLDAA